MWSRFNQLPRLLVAVFLAIGVGTLWGLVVGVAMDAIDDPLFGRGDTEELLVRSDAIVIHRAVRSGQWTNTYRFSDGRPITLEDFKQWADSPASQWLTPVGFSGPTAIGESFAPPAWDYRLMRFWISGKDLLRWYLVHDGLREGHAYFVGYEAGTNELVGYLGKSGFDAVIPAQDQQFAFDGRRLVPARFTSAVVSKTTSGRVDPATRTYESPNLPESAIYLLSGDEVWHIDLRHRTVDLRGRFADAIDLELAPRPPQSPDAPGDIDEELMVRTRTEMIKIDLEGKVLHRWALPEDARGKELISWYDLGNDKALIMFPRRAINRYLEEEFIWLDNDGKIERRETVELLQGGLEPHEVWTISPALPVPVALTLAFYLTAGEVRGPEYSDNFAKILALFWPALLTVYLVSALLAVFAYRRQTRFSLPGAGTWAAFVFLLGVPGWLAFRWHRNWPVVEPCTFCHKSAPRDRDACAHCGELFPPPTRIGTEVFE